MLQQLRLEIVKLVNRLEAMENKESPEYLNVLAMRKALTARYNGLLVQLAKNELFKAYDYHTRKLLATNASREGLVNDCLSMGACFDVIIKHPDGSVELLAETLDI